MRSMLVLVSLAIAALASPAAACEKISVLVYAIDSGRAEARLNGVPVVSSGSEDTITGMLQIGHWYLAGDNVLEVKSIGADAKVRIELTDSCQGQMVCTASTLRPAWRDLFTDHATCKHDQNPV